MHSELLQANPVKDETPLDYRPSLPGAAPAFSGPAPAPCRDIRLPGVDFLTPKAIPPASRVRAPWRPRVLYLDDRKGIRDAVSHLLRMTGCPCETVASAEAACRRCISDGSAIDVVITEHVPPRFTALELVEKLRETSFEGKIFLHSARLTEEEQASIAQLTVDWLVIKPGGLADILQGLEEWQSVSALF